MDEFFALFGFGLIVLIFVVIFGFVFDIFLNFIHKILNDINNIEI